MQEILQKTVFGRIFGQFWALGLLFALGLTLRLIVARYFAGIYYPDEIFQSKEAAHHLLYGYGVTPWEWRDGVRSLVFPYFLVVIMRATAWLANGSYGYLIAIDTVVASLSLTIIWFCYEWARRVAGQFAGLIAGGTAAIWFTLVIFGSKTFSEMIATDIMLPGLLVGSALLRGLSRKNTFVAGLLYGLAVAIRPQFAPTVAFICLWTCWSDLRKQLPLFVGGAVIPIIAFGIFDAFTLEYPFASFVKYFWINVANGKAKQYGTEPWYFYLKQMLRYCSVLLIPAAFGLRRSPVLGWIILVLVGSHSVLAHKEFRFVYAVVPLTIALAGIGCQELLDLLDRHQLPTFTRIAALAFPVIIAVSSLYGLQSSKPKWFKRHGELTFADALSKDPSLCGLGYYGIHFSETGGYSHLHRAVPIIYMMTPSQLAQDLTQFNVLVTEQDAFQMSPAGFTLSECISGACEYRRFGNCAPPGPDEVNQVLRRTGE